MESVRLGPLKPGDVFAEKYEVKRLIGSGGHAFVYECFDRFLSRVVAIKVIKAGGDGAASLHARARTEAQLLVRIDHPHLVKVIDAGVSQGFVYLVMEYLEGRSLREVLRELGRLSVAETLRIGVQIADGMAHAHTKGVIHRDLKPENIFILFDNGAKVLDFGIAKVRGLDGLDAKTTAKDLVQGTLLYMSPEHLQGHPVTPQSDIFAFGTVLFECLFAHPLRVGEAPVGRDEAAWMQMFRVPPLLSDLEPAIPRYVAKAIHRAVLKIASERYGDMAELRDTLATLLKRHLDEDSSGGVVVMRQLYKPQSSDASPKAASLQTLRTAAVLTNQVTVKAPHVLSGNTEPLPNLPPSTEQPPSKDPGAGVTFDLPAKPTRQTPARLPASPLLSDQPTIFVTSEAARVPSTPPGPPAATVQPAATPPSDRQRLATGAGTAPPVAARVPTHASRPVPPPFFQDRAIRIAAIAAVVLGAIAGTAYGLRAPGPAGEVPTPTLSATDAVSSAAATSLAQRKPTAPDTPAMAASTNVPSQPPESQSAAFPDSAMSSPSRPLPTSESPSASRSTAIKASRRPAEATVDSGLPTPDEVRPRVQGFDRNAKTVPKPAAKPAPTTPSRSDHTIF